MADINILYEHEVQIHAGQRGYKEVFGVAQFNGTDTSGDLRMRLKTILDFSATAIAELPDAITVDESAAVAGNGMLVVPADGKLRLVRLNQAGGTTDKFFFRYRGY